MSVCQLRIENVILIILQLFFAGFIVICLDELLLEGYDFSSGISVHCYQYLAGLSCWHIVLC